jgi:hypothetical protein
VSVDTYLRGKNTKGYTRLRRGDVEILVAPSLLRWANGVHVDTTSFLFRKKLSVFVDHRHTNACRH